MNTIAMKFFRVLVRYLIKKKKIDLLEQYEHEVLIELGRGWGAETYKEEVQLVKSQTQKMNLETMVIFDIGANIGKYSAELCRNFPESRIIAFEPNPNSYHELIKLKDSFQNFEAFNLGVSRESGRQALYAPDVGSPLSSVDNKNPNYKKIEIDVISLADFCRTNNFIPNVIKIDVEGHEFQVLLGAEKILEHIRLIQFEFGPTNIHSRIFLKDIWDYLTPKGFQLNIMTKSGLLEVSKYREIYESFRTTNYLAIRN